MLKHPERISYNDLQEAINNLPTHEKQIATLAYATGARVSELIQIRKQDIQITKNTPDYLTITCPVLKKNRKPKDPLKRLAWKKRNHERIALVRLSESWLVEPIQQRCNELVNPSDVLVPLNRFKVYRILNKIVVNNEPINPHGFRHLRATHLRKNFGFDPYQLQMFFGWATIEPSSFYVGLDTQEIEY